MRLPPWLSAISLWEIALKIQIGKLDLPKEPEFYLKHVLKLQAQVLAVGTRHSLGVLNGPLHRKVPFDRVLVAQAREEAMASVTRNPILSQYPVKTLW